MQHRSLRRHYRCGREPKRQPKRAPGTRPAHSRPAHECSCRRRPPDDGIAEPGMVLTVRYDETGETETFLLGVPGAEAGDIEVYSMQSPLGTAIAGARAGQRTPILSPAARPCP